MPSTPELSSSVPRRRWFVSAGLTVVSRTPYPASRAAVSIAVVVSAGPNSEDPSVRTPMREERVVFRARAARFLV
jgi:hypothetical protein